MTTIYLLREITTNDDSQETTVNTIQQRMYKDNFNFKINKRGTVKAHVCDTETVVDANESTKLMHKER